MADSSFGLKIGLEGEREFKKSIADINRQMRVLGSEMKLVASQFDKNDKSAAALTSRSQVLGKEIEAQKAKITTLKAALDNASTSFGQNDARTRNWQIQLNNAAARLNELERELKTNNDALEEFGQGAANGGKDAKDAAKGVDKLADEVDDLGGQMDETGKKTSVFGDVLKANLATTAIIGGVKAIGAAIKGIGKGFAQAMKDGVEYNAQMESYTASFTTMLGDQAKAQKLVTDLKKEAAATPFGMADLAGSVQTLMAFGMSAQDAQKHLRQLGDISQGDSEKLKSLTLAFAQISSTGKLTGQDLLQMVNAGFNPLEEISRKTGKSIGELKEEMAKGAISADMVADALESATQAGGRFYGAMEKQSQTFSGQLSTLQDGIANLKGQLASGLSTLLAGTVMPMVNGWVDELSRAFEEGGLPAVIETAGQILQEALDFIASQLPKVIETAMTIIVALVDGLIAALPQIAEAAVQLVVALVQGIVDALPALAQAAVTVVLTLVQGIGTALPELIPAAIGAILTVVQTLLDNLPMILNAALQLILGLAQGILNALPMLVAALPKVIEAIVNFFVAGIPMIIQAGIQLLTSLIGALPTIINEIVKALPLIITSIINGFLGAQGALVTAGLQLFVALIGALPTIIHTVVMAIPQIIGSVLNALISNIPTMARMGFDLFVSLIRFLPQIIYQIAAAVPQIIYSIISAFGSLYNQMFSIGKNIVIGLWNGLVSLSGWLWDMVYNWISGIWRGIKRYFGISSPSKKMAWAGKMLAQGLAGGIDDDSDKAIDSAQNLSAGVSAAFNDLQAGITVPVKTGKVDVPNLRDQATTTAASSSGGGSGMAGSSAIGLGDVYNLIRDGFKEMSKALDVEIVLNDRTLVGRLAPRIDAQIGGYQNARKMIGA